MKSILILTVMCVVIVTADNEEVTKKFLTEINAKKAECAKKLGATVDDLNELVQGKVPKSKEVKCTLFCFFEQFGAQNANGKINKQDNIPGLEILKELEAEIYNKLLTVWRSCSEKATEENDGCDTAVNLMICIDQEIEKQGIDKSIVGL